MVDRRFAFTPADKEQFRIYMRMMENFSGCRVLSYCVMCNHVHLLLEVRPMPKAGLTDAELLRRLRALYSKAEVAVVAKELAAARHVAKEMPPGNGKAHVTGGGQAMGDGHAMEIHGRYTYRMHDLSEFMKTLLQRFTRWHNKMSKRRGNLWEETFKSVVVEDGLASRAMAAYIDLNPVRAGMVEDPADYRWSSYGEAVGGGGLGDGKKARAGLARAIMADKGLEADARHWPGRVSREYRMLLLQEGQERTREVVNEAGVREEKVVRKGMKARAVAAEAGQLMTGRDVALGRMLKWRVRYFTDGAVIGSRAFVDDFFEQCRDRFGPKRKSGARKLRGKAADGGAAGLLWSARDLRRGIG